MRVSDFDFELPAELIAQEAVPRGRSRLLVLERSGGRCQHQCVADLPDLLAPGDLFVVNDTRVFPARLLGRRIPSGGAVECMLLAKAGEDLWEALMHPGQKLGPGARVLFESKDGALGAEVVERRFYGRRLIRMRAERGGGVEALIDRLGHVPLPPYIHREDREDDRERYQTVYARHRGSVAAPTAGLHFTDDLLSALADRSIERVAITLHVGYGTFKPVRSDNVEEHTVDPEPYAIDQPAADVLNEALATRRRIVCVGTTTTRALENAVRAGGGRVVPGQGRAEVFIYPGFTFQATGALLTNFHLPRSSLLMLVAAFAGRDLVLEAYREAVRQRYRFYSYGDAMLVL